MAADKIIAVACYMCFVGLWGVIIVWVMAMAGEVQECPLCKKRNARYEIVLESGIRIYVCWYCFHQLSEIVGKKENKDE